MWHPLPEISNFLPKVVDDMRKMGMYMQHEHFILASKIGWGSSIIVQSSFQLIMHAKLYCLLLTEFVWNFRHDQ